MPPRFRQHARLPRHSRRHCCCSAELKEKPLIIALPTPPCTTHRPAEAVCAQHGAVLEGAHEREPLPVCHVAAHGTMRAPPEHAAD